MGKLEKPFKKGEQKYIGIKVSSNENIDLTIPLVQVKKCPNGEIVLAETAAETEILTINTVWAVKYNLDVAGYDPGEYFAEFTFTRDAVETRKDFVEFEVIDNPCK